ncbi:MAG TPA: hypothetical protein DD412_01835 [Holosporales bacterium]|nr:hypothetical protein [Holosporales bacterium]
MHILISTALYFKNKPLFYQKVIQFLDHKNISYIKYLEIHVVKKGEESYLNSSFRKKLIKLADLEKVMVGGLPPALQEESSPHAQIEFVFVCLSKDKLPVCALETGDTFQEIDTLTFMEDPYEELKLDCSFASKKYNFFVPPESQLMAGGYSIRDLKHPVFYEVIIGVSIFVLLIEDSAELPIVKSFSEVPSFHLLT